MATQQSTNNAPALGLKNGTLHLSVWENQTDEGKQFETVALSRAYFDEDVQDWKYSNRFGIEDLPRLIFLMQDAYQRRRHTESTSIDASASSTDCADQAKPPFQEE